MRKVIGRKPVIEAINSGNEIMINGAYYAINYKIGVNMTLEDK